VDVLDAFVNHVGAATGDVVDDASDGDFVSRNGPRRQHDGVIRTDLHVPVIVDRNPRQGRHRFALRAGRHAQHVLGGVAADVGIADLHAGGNAEIAEPLRDLGILDHSTADERNLPIELRREVDEQLHAVDARRERRDDQPAGRAGEDLLERLDDFGLRAGEAAAVDVRAVRKQREHTRRAELREAVDVEMLAVDRRLIDLEVAGVDHDAAWRVNGQRDAVRDAMRHTDELDLERADRDTLGGTHSREPRAGHVDTVFHELRLDEREGERCAVHRAVDIREDERDAADVVFVAVRQHKGGDPPLLLQVRQVRNDQIDAQQFRIGEHDAGVDDDRRVGPGEREHVHAELAEAAEWYNVEHRFRAYKPTPAGSRRNRFDVGSRDAARSGCWESLK
jgi:hypothetical protein